MDLLLGTPKHSRQSPANTPAPILLRPTPAWPRSRPSLCSAALQACGCSPVVVAVSSRRPALRWGPLPSFSLCTLLSCCLEYVTCARHHLWTVALIAAGVESVCSSMSVRKRKLCMQFSINSN
ncbi:hypothetical protein ABVT39_000042 [Epinephelus coioides]